MDRIWFDQHVGVHGADVGHGLRKDSVVVAVVAGALLALLLVPGPAANVALAQGAKTTADDDPFADELNPLGGGKPRPAVPGGVAPRAQGPLSRPQPELPTVPPEPGTGRPLTPDLGDPDRAAPGVERGRRDRALPLPFPEAEEDGAAGGEPSPADAFLLEAEKLEKAKRFREAEAVLRKAVKADPKNTLASLALGMVRRRLGDLDGAIDAYSAGLRVDDFDGALHFRRGLAWFRLGEHRIALEDFDDAAGLSFDDPMPELWKGLTLMELDRPRDAIVAYSAAIQRDRSLMIAYLNRGLAYLVSGEPDKAETDFELAIRHDPDDARAWFNRGVAQARQREYDHAAASFSRAVRLDPSFTAARQNLDAVRGRTNRPTGG
jgi:Tfp pilus assembly protein PilF